MADEVRRPIQIYQALHGYADGHRLLASSASIKPRDQKTMLIMSDVSGAGASISENGYLTGYPLSDSGVFALARTWAATEMARPGCVWTHTLLIDFADLASLTSLDFLDKQFKRPSDNLSEGDFSKTLSILSNSADDRRVKVGVAELEGIISALYEKPREKVLTEISSSAEDMVFLIWAQQWPRLRRSFRFCTSSFSDRSTEAAKFDLQFSPIRERSYRTRFSDVVDVTKTPATSAAWLAGAVDDMFSGRGGLRDFLKNVGGDIPGGREMFAPLCSVYAMIPGFGLTSGSIAEAIALVNSVFEPSSATSLRGLIVSGVAQHFERLDPESASFLLKHLDLLNSADPAYGVETLGKKLWTLVPVEILSLVEVDTGPGVYAKNIVGIQKACNLVSVGEQNPRLMPKLVSLRPDILEDSHVWSIEGDWAREALMVSKMDPHRLLSSLLRSKRMDLAEVAVNKYGSARVLANVSEELVATQEESMDPLFDTWLDLCSRDTDAIAKTFTTIADLHIRLLVEIARRTHPDQIPNAIGKDPWATAIEIASGKLDGESHQYLCAYLLARVLGYRSNSQAEIACYAFDEIYFAALHARLSDQAWQLVDQALPRSWWFEWDRCQRLRDAVTDIFINRDLPVGAFAGLTRDTSLFQELCRLAARNSRGRKYLKRVIHWFEDSGDNRRKEMLEKLV